MNRKRIIFSALLICIFVAKGQDNKGVMIDQVVAVVGKNIIKHSDIENNYAQMRVQMGYDNAFNNRCAILESLLMQKLLLHKGAIDSVEIPDQYVDAEVDRQLKMRLKYFGSKENMERESGQKYEDIVDSYKKVMSEYFMAQQVESGVVENVKITPREVTDFFNSIPVDSLPIIEAEYEVSEIVISPKVNEAERERVRLELNKLRERILKGDKFSTLATLYSEDPGTAKKGGELGFFTRGEMVGEFEAAAFALKPGEVSPVIETKYGFHIIQLIERRGNMLNARHILLSAKATPEDLVAAHKRLDSVVNEVRNGKLSFEEAARNFSDSQTKIEGGVVTNPQTGNNRFSADMLRQVFVGVNIERMTEGEISGIISSKNDMNQDVYKVVKLVRVIESHKANLVDDYDKIYTIALQNAKGKWIAFLDSDDIWHPEKLERQIEFMLKNNYNFSYTNYCEINEKSEETGLLITGPKVINKNKMLAYCWPGCLTVMYDAEFVGLMQTDEIKINEEYALWIKISRKTKCHLLDENLAKYRRHSNSLSNRSYCNLIKWHYLMFRKAENKNIFSALFFTLGNIIFGTYKKIFYRKKTSTSSR
jgi:peptidyl-prolyl cis-trans isomerase SurA